MTGQDGLREEIAAALAEAEDDDIAVPLECADYAITADAVLPVVQRHINAAREQVAEYSLEDLSMSAQERDEFELRAARDAAVPRVASAEAEIKQLRAYRLVMAVFGVPAEAPQPFALLGDDDKPFALGVQWPGGAVTVKSTPPERLGNVTSASLDDYFTQYGTSPVVWLSEDLGTLAEHEERAMAAEQALQRVRGAFQRWSGGPDDDFEQAMRRALDGPAEPQEQP